MDDLSLLGRHKFQNDLKVSILNRKAAGGTIPKFYNAPLILVSLFLVKSATSVLYISVEKYLGFDLKQFEIWSFYV